MFGLTHAHVIYAVKSSTGVAYTLETEKNYN